jgi:hypothetical protein
LLHDVSTRKAGNASKGLVASFAFQARGTSAEKRTNESIESNPLLPNQQQQQQLQPKRQKLSVKERAIANGTFSESEDEDETAVAPQDTLQPHGAAVSAHDEAMVEQLMANTVEEVENKELGYYNEQEVVKMEQRSPCARPQYPHQQQQQQHQLQNQHQNQHQYQHQNQHQQPHQHQLQHHQQQQLQLQHDQRIQYERQQRLARQQQVRSN